MQRRNIPQKDDGIRRNTVHSKQNEWTSYTPSRTLSKDPLNSKRRDEPKVQKAGVQAPPQKRVTATSSRTPISNTKSIPQKHNTNTVQNTKTPTNTARPRPTPSRQRSVNGIKAQTPQNRRLDRSQNRIDPVSAEISRRRRKTEKFYVNKKRKNSFKLFISRFFAFLVTYVIIAVVFAVGFVINLTSSNAVSLDKAVTYQLGNDSENTSTIMLSDIYKNSKIYINMDDIARLCNMATTGDINELRFISLDNESENVSFVLSTRIAFVNGEEIRLTSDTIAKNDIVYVPIEFFNEYVEGITVNYDEDESTLKILKDVVETKTILNTDGSETAEEIYAPLKFKLKAQKPSESINEALVPQKAKK